MKVEASPRAGGMPGCAGERHQQQDIFQKIKTVVEKIVSIDVQDYVLIGKDDEGVEEGPPAQQHQKIQCAEAGAGGAFGQVWTPANRRNHGHHVKEENDVEEIRIGNL